MKAKHRFLLSTLLMSLTSCFSGSGTSIKTAPPPTIESAQASTYAPAAGQVVSFTASCSGSSALTYSWDFGDGNHTTGQTVTNTYSAAKDYTVSATCMDSLNQSSSTTLPTVIVGQPQLASVLTKRCSGKDPGAGWCWQDPLPLGRINALAEADSFVLWAVGAGGTIQQSGDGGITWQSQDSGTTANLTAVSVVDRATVWAGGSTDSTTGAMVLTTDGGLTWTPTAAPTGTVVALAAVDKHTSWGCTSAGLSQTQDGGKTWTVQAANLGLTSCLSVSANGPTSAWATTTRDTNNGSRTANVVIATTDGVNWSVVGDSTNLPGPPAGPLPDAPFYVAAVRGTSEAWLCQDNSFASGYSYHFDGVKWTEYQAKLAPMVHLPGCTGIAVSRTNSQLVLINTQLLLFTTDGGSNWQTFPKTNDGVPNLMLIAFAAEDQNIGWVTDGSAVIRTQNGPANFAAPAFSPGPAAGVLDLVDDQVAFAVGRGQLLETTNGGTSWSSPVGTSPATNLVTAGSAQLAWFIDSTQAVQELSIGQRGLQFGIRGYEPLANKQVLDVKFARAPTITGYPSYNFDCDRYGSVGGDLGIVGVCAVLWAIGGSQFFYAYGANSIGYNPNASTAVQIPFATTTAPTQSGVALSVVDTSTAWALARETSPDPGGSGNLLIQDEVMLVHASGNPATTTPVLTPSLITTHSHISCNACALKVSISAVDAHSAWVSFSDSTIYLVTDAGAVTLVPQPDSSNPQASDYVVAAIDANTAWVGSRSGSLSKTNSNSSLWYTTNGGGQWTPQSNFGVRISSINPIPGQPGTAWISGPDGILKTETAGQ